MSKVAIFALFTILIFDLELFRQLLVVLVFYFTTFKVKKVRFRYIRYFLRESVVNYVFYVLTLYSLSYFLVSGKN